MYDFTLDDHGSIVLLRPENQEATAWIQINLGSGITWSNGAVAIERQYVTPILYSINADNLTWSPDPTPTIH